MLQKIASFSIDHDILMPGLHVSRVDGNDVTYDIRMKRPNMGDYISQGALHTLEHLIATYIRSSKYGDQVVYFGPMGCRTGCYMILRDTVSKAEALALTREAFAWTAAFEGEIPGAKHNECGNYLEHDLADAKREAAAYVKVLDHCDETTFVYPKMGEGQKTE